MKKLFAIFLSVTFIICSISISAYAEDTSENKTVVTIGQTDFIFENNTSNDFQNSFIESYTNNCEDETTAYGLTCTLFGHKLESAVVSTITHKVNSTDPRCLQEYYNHEACSRCDYSNSTLISQSFISCC